MISNVRELPMKALTILFACALLSSCVKIDARDTTDDNPFPANPKSDYVCDCTYISSGTDPKKEEATKLTNRTKMEADVDCASLQGKYIMQQYDGTCVVK